MRKTGRHGSRGSVFLLAMVSVMVLMLLGTSLVEVAINGLARASNSQKRAQALALAEAGIEMALEKMYDNYDLARDQVLATGHYSETLTLPEGDVNYTITHPYQGISHTIQVEATSTTWTHRSETVRVIAKYDDSPDGVFRGAIFCDSQLTLAGGGSVLPDPDTGLGGDIYANGDITFTEQGGAFTMDPSGNIFTTGVVTDGNVPDGVSAANVHTEIAQIPMPSIDLQYYRNYPGATIINPPGGTAFFVDHPPTNNKQYSLTGLSGVYYVRGDVQIAGNYTGQAVIVATGTITITGNVVATNPDVDTLAFVSPKAIKINGNPEIWGLIYSHGVEAYVTVGGSPIIHGAVVADVVSTNGGMTVQFDDVWSGLPIPGMGLGQWAQVSWEELLQ